MTTPDLSSTYAFSASASEANGEIALRLRSLATLCGWGTTPEDVARCIRDEEPLGQPYASETELIASFKALGCTVTEPWIHFGSVGQREELVTIYG